MVASNLLLGLLVLLGLYSGNMLVNLNPPNVTLLLLGISQAAALQLFRPGAVPDRVRGRGCAG